MSPTMLCPTRISCGRGVKLRVTPPQIKGLEMSERMIS